MRRYRSFVLSPFVAAAMAFGAGDAEAANLAELMASVPAPPKDMATTMNWVQNGQIIEPGYLQLKAAIEAERAAEAALNGGTPPLMGTAPSPNIPEAPELQAAIRGYDAYLNDNSGTKEPKAALAKRTRWLQAAMGEPTLKLFEKWKPCPYPCQDAAINAANAPFEAQKQEMVERDLRTWTSLFTDWKTTRSAIVNRASAQIAAAGDGSKAATPDGKSAMAQYRAAILKEVELTLSITELAVRRTDAIARNAVDAISSSTRNKAKEEEYKAQHKK
ncbi:MAG: hypothetical protein JWQ90_3385 [Hydrocarboniphaga sp.]|uniref:hypothetical protein n=1 Tax=Hydrocarboniphaga sp. TaxID=2033016 RepID=UPI00262570D6|nr:hypothetical protein [Hydrocarboniphaga sp.]MDB5970935.1 hypothetical protein [Hydrocarboniphaga sp.]